MYPTLAQLVEKLNTRLSKEQLGYAHHQYKGIRTIHNKTKSNNALGDNTMGPRHNLWNSRLSLLPTALKGAKA